MRNIAFLAVVFIFLAFPAFAQDATEGALFAVNKKGVRLGACPLKQTSVRTSISGFLARVTVVQEFQNTFNEPIEAVYTFPLSQNSAVDTMTMTIGTRTVRGRLMKREEAQKVYEQAKTDGKTAALLDQERPNVFTQAVANILPGDRILIEISYVETLKYESGAYEFVFPMTVAPRYNPKSVKDSSKINPPSDIRGGHDISIEVNLDAGVPIEEIRSNSHEIETVNSSSNSAVVKLKNEKTIPNKDFILRYDVSGKRLEDAVLTHKSAKGGYFTLILQPPDEPRIEDVTPKEIVFVLDSSGSMSGFPIEKAKEAMLLSLEGLYPHDTFNLITFAGDTSILSDAPVPATEANLEKARQFIQTEGAGGGTEMMKAIRAAFAPTDSQAHIRIVCFMTDGLVGNEAEIIAEVQKHPKARVFSFGIGASVNRYLLDKIALEGHGEAEYVSLNDDGTKAARKFYERVRTPMLTDISIDWNGLPVADVYPKQLTDMFSAKPVILHGRYENSGVGKILLKGKLSGRDYSREIDVALPDAETANDVLGTLWARSRINELTKTDYTDADAEIRREITNLSLEFGLLTSFTSFVAVEEQIRNVGGQTQKVAVPVNRPDNGETDTPSSRIESPNWKRPRNVTTSKSNRRSGDGFGMGTGRGNGVADGVGVSTKTISTGVINGKAVELIRPVYPAAARAVRASGAVNVQVVIDEKGDVISASAVSGHPLLRAAAVQAARQSKFVPTVLSGTAVKVTGVIVYNFTNPDNLTANSTSVVLKDETKPLTPEMQAEFERLEKERKAEAERLKFEKEFRQKRAEKFHFWVYAVFARLRDGKSVPGPNESRFVLENRAALEIRLKAVTPETLEKLQKLGFEIVSNDQKTTVIGRLAIEKISELADINQIELVLPFISV